jgi:hypothetical protein
MKLSCAYIIAHARHFRSLIHGQVILGNGLFHPLAEQHSNSHLGSFDCRQLSGGQTCGDTIAVHYSVVLISRSHAGNQRPSPTPDTEHGPLLDTRWIALLKFSNTLSAYANLRSFSKRVYADVASYLETEKPLACDLVCVMCTWSNFIHFCSPCQRIRVKLDTWETAHEPCERSIQGVIFVQHHGCGKVTCFGSGAAIPCFVHLYKVLRCATACYLAYHNVRERI